MVAKYTSRREFLNFSKLSLLFFLSSCSKISKKKRIALYKSIYPDVLKDTIPDVLQQKNINFEKIYSEKNRNIIFDYDLTIVNDGWINKINFKDFREINESILFNKLDKRSSDFLKFFDENQRKKLLPIGVVPYAIIIKNNKDLINSAKESWDFLLSRKLTGKIIFPESQRIMISIAKKINSSNSLYKLKKQAFLYDDQNALNWLINSEACLAIIPYSFSLKYLKVDSRLSVSFPVQGVPLMWHFVLSRSNSNNQILNSWIKSLEMKLNVDKLASQGWYLPLKNEYSQSKYNIDYSNTLGPPKICWDNSWSFPLLTNSEKIELENYWNGSLTP